jgi:hypothetical protein
MPIFANFKLINDIPNRIVLKKHDTKIKQAQSSSGCNERPSGGPQSYGRSGANSARNVRTKEPKKETAARVPRKIFMNVDLVIFHLRGISKEQ